MGDPEHLGGLLDREPGEEAQLDEAGLPFVEGGEPRERAVEVEEVQAPRRRRDGAGRVELDPDLSLAALGACFARRAWSTSTCRIARAATPKKWARSFQSIALRPTSFR